MGLDKDTILRIAQKEVADLQSRGKLREASAGRDFTKEETATLTDAVVAIIDAEANAAPHKGVERADQGL